MKTSLLKSLLLYTCIGAFLSCSTEITRSPLPLERDAEFTDVEMVSVRGCTFNGSPENAVDNNDGCFAEEKEYTINDFQISKYEVTKELYQKILSNANLNYLNIDPEPSATSKHPRERLLKAGEADNLRPVESITKYDAIYFCNLLSKNYGLEPVYELSDLEIKFRSIRNATVTVNKDADGFRLPERAEWEFAARGGNPAAPEWKYAYPGKEKPEDVATMASKDSTLDSIAWYCYNTATGITGDKDFTYDLTEEVQTLGGDFYISTHQVGLLAPNSLGLYDMAGNVREYTIDDNPMGGSFFFESCISTVTYSREPYITVGEAGIRLCRSGNNSDKLVVKVEYKKLTQENYKPLRGRRIVLDASLGLKKDGLKWKWQREIKNNIREDCWTQIFVMDYLGPKLKALGADVIYTRDTSEEIGESGKPKWQECAYEYLKNKGMDHGDIIKKYLNNEKMYQNLVPTGSDVTIRSVYSLINKADIQISIHTNASSESTSSGSIVYVWFPDGPTSSKTLRPPLIQQWVNEKNFDSTLGCEESIEDGKEILKKIWPPDTRLYSFVNDMLPPDTYRLAKKIQPAMNNAFVEYSNNWMPGSSGVVSRGWGSAIIGSNFGVLRVLRNVWYNNRNLNPITIPAVRLEMGFHTNSKDSRILRSIGAREDAASELCQAVIEFFNEKN
jgi:formylglycine-generating enzyme required for sulfatase activity